MYDLTKHKKRMMALLVQSFYAWRQFAITSKARKQRLQRALRWYSEVRHSSHNT